MWAECNFKSLLHRQRCIIKVFLRHISVAQADTKSNQNITFEDWWTCQLRTFGGRLCSLAGSTHNWLRDVSVMLGDCNYVVLSHRGVALAACSLYFWVILVLSLLHEGCADKSSWSRPGCMQIALLRHLSVVLAACLLHFHMTAGFSLLHAERNFEQVWYRHGCMQVVVLSCLCVLLAACRCYL